MMNTTTNIQNLVPSLIVSCTRISTQLSTCVAEAKLSDPRSLESLAVEIGSLSNILNEIHANELPSTPRLSINSAEEDEFVRKSEQITQECGENLERLEKLLKECQGGKWGFSSNRRMATRFNQANAEFTSYRHVLKSYKETLSNILHIERYDGQLMLYFVKSTPSLRHKICYHIDKRKD